MWESKRPHTHTPTQRHTHAHTRTHKNAWRTRTVAFMKDKHKDCKMTSCQFASEYERIKEEARLERAQQPDELFTFWDSQTALSRFKLCKGTGFDTVPYEAWKALSWTSRMKILAVLKERSRGATHAPDSWKMTRLVALAKTAKPTSFSECRWIATSSTLQKCTVRACSTGLLYDTLTRLCCSMAHVLEVSGASTPST